LILFNAFEGWGLIEQGASKFFASKRGLIGERRLNLEGV